MTTPYVGEIRLLSFPRIPTGWFACDGSLKSIADYQTLFMLLGTTYGGDGNQTFGVPDLRGQIPVHQGTGTGLTPRVLGQSTGFENITLTLSEIPHPQLPGDHEPRNHDDPGADTHDRCHRHRPSLSEQPDGTADSDRAGPGIHPGRRQEPAA